MLDDIIDGIFEFIGDVADAVWSAIVFLFDLVWDSLAAFSSFVANALTKLVAGAKGVFVSLVDWVKVKPKLPPDVARPIEIAIKKQLEDGNVLTPEDLKKLQVQITGQFGIDGSFLRADSIGVPRVGEPVRAVMRANNNCMLIQQNK